MKLKAIETTYKQYRFRSRTEARWAVFLDKAGIAWDYEIEGYETAAGWYLPDFWLTDLGLWLEIKPRAELITEYDWKRIESFSSGLNAEGLGRILVLVGQPWIGSYEFWSNRKKDPYHKIWGKCCLCGRVQPLYPESCCPNEEIAFCPACDIWDRNEQPPNGFSPAPGCYFHKGNVVAPRGFDWESCEVRLAFAAARRARFEHGETP